LPRPLIKASENGHALVTQRRGLISLKGEPMLIPKGMPCGATIYDPSDRGVPSYCPDDEEPMDDYDYDEEKAGIVIIIDKETK